jgi:hypothetical protein
MHHKQSVGSVAKSALFGGRPIGTAIETLLTKVLIQRSSVSPIVVFYVAAAIFVA